MSGRGFGEAIFRSTVSSTIFYTGIYSLRKNRAPLSLERRGAVMSEFKSSQGARPLRFPVLVPTAVIGTSIAAAAVVQEGPSTYVCYLATPCSVFGLAPPWTKRLTVHPKLSVIASLRNIFQAVAVGVRAWAIGFRINNISTISYVGQFTMEIILIIPCRIETLCRYTSVWG